MTENRATDATVLLPDAPPLPGLAVRPYRGEEDLPAMLAVIIAEREADHSDWVPALEDTLRNYRHLTNCDPTRDALIVELDGQVIGYCRVWWYQESDGRRLYPSITHLMPAWRGLGLRRALLRWNERRAKEIAAETPGVSRIPGFYPRFFQVETQDGEHNLLQALTDLGYQPVRYGFEMIRPTLDDVPDLPLPPGLELRPARPEQFRAIWDGMSEAFRDHWGYSDDEWGEPNYQNYAESGRETCSLWQIAWCGDEVAGAVHAEIQAKENAALGRKRGYTEGIFVRRPWRRQGLAKALIARSLKALKEQGMDHAAHGVDAENPNGALQLYQSMGYQVHRTFTVHRKEMADG